MNIIGYISRKELIILIFTAAITSKTEKIYKYTLIVFQKIYPKKVDKRKKILNINFNLLKIYNCVHDLNNLYWIYLNYIQLI